MSMTILNDWSIIGCCCFFVTLQGYQICISKYHLSKDKGIDSPNGLEREISLDYV